MSGGVVGTRKMTVNARYICGFICPDFAAITAELSGKNEREDIENILFRTHSLVEYAESGAVHQSGQRRFLHMIFFLKGLFRLSPLLPRTLFCLFPNRHQFQELPHPFLHMTFYRH